MKNYVVGLFLFVFLSACKKEDGFDCEGIRNEAVYDQSDFSLLSNSLMFDWELVCAINPWTSEEISSEHVGDHNRVKFYESGIVQFFLNEELVRESIWMLRKAPVDVTTPLDSMYFLHIEGGNNDLFEVGLKKLRINQTPYDGFDMYYARR